MKFPPEKVLDISTWKKHAGTLGVWMKGGVYENRTNTTERELSIHTYWPRTSPIGINQGVIGEHVEDLVGRTLDSGKIKYIGDIQKLKDDLIRELIPSEILTDLGIEQIPIFKKRMSYDYGMYGETVDVNEGITQDARNHLRDIIKLAVEDSIVSHTGMPAYDSTKSLVPQYERKINKAFKKVMREAIQNPDESKIPLETLLRWRDWDRHEPRYGRVEKDLLYRKAARNSSRRSTKSSDESFAERKPLALQDWVRDAIMDEVGINLIDEPAYETRAIGSLDLGIESKFQEYIEDAANEFMLYQSKKARDFLTEKYPLDKF